MRLRSTFFVLCGLVVFLLGCTPAGILGYDYTYQNSTSKRIHVDIYKTMDDYTSNTNKYISGVAEPGGKFVVPSTKFVAGVPYFVDWYTEDYTYTNWVHGINTYGAFTPILNPTDQLNLDKLETVTDYARLMCLNGNGAGTKWRAVDGYFFIYGGSNGGDSILWKDLPTKWQYFEMEFHKDFNSIYYYNAPSYAYNANNGVRTAVHGICKTNEGGIAPGATTGGFTVRVANDEFAVDEAYMHFVLTAPAGTPGAVIKDTVTITIVDIGVFKMVRENII